LPGVIAAVRSKKLEPVHVAAATFLSSGLVGIYLGIQVWIWALMLGIGLVLLLATIFVARRRKLVSS